MFMDVLDLVQHLGEAFPVHLINSCLSVSLSPSLRHFSPLHLLTSNTLYILLPSFIFYLPLLKCQLHEGMDFCFVPWCI